MLRFFKYMYVLSVLKRSKLNIVVLVSLLLVLMLGIMIFNDLISVYESKSIYLYLLAKWVFIVFMLALIIATFAKIIHIAINPLKSKDNAKESDVDKKKQKLVEKEKLLTKSDLIMKRYRQNMSKY